MDRPVDVEICDVDHPAAVAAATALLHQNDTYINLAALFGALADPTRAKIVHLLLNRELCTCDIAGAVGVTDSAVSQHLRLLRSMRLVKSRREGKFVYYSLDDAHIALLLQAGLTHQGHTDGAPSGTTHGASREAR
jgi:DNA-binding transcriptional ArsR family regulator